MTRIAHVYDDLGAYVRTVTVGDKEGRPRNSTMVEPPGEQDDKVRVWSGSEWLQMDSVPEPVPMSVTKRQAKEALIRQGLYQDCLDAIAAIGDPTTKLLAQNYWQESQAFERDNAMLNDLAINGVGMTSAQLDDLFRYAETL